MNRRPKLRVLIALIIVTIAVAVAVTMVVLFGLESKYEIEPVSTPRLLYDFDLPQHIEGMKGTVNTTQGATVHINLTLTSICTAKMAIPIEPLKLTRYSENFTELWGPLPLPWEWEKQELPIQEEIFSYSLSLNRLTLEPGMSNSTIITISLANNVPVGIYTIRLHFEKIEFLSEPGEHDRAYEGGMGLLLIVASSG